MTKTEHTVGCLSIFRGHLSFFHQRTPTRRHGSRLPLGQRRHPPDTDRAAQRSVQSVDVPLSVFADKLTQCNVSEYKDGSIYISIFPIEFGTETEFLWPQSPTEPPPFSCLQWALRIGQCSRLLPSSPLIVHNWGYDCCSYGFISFTAWVPVTSRCYKMKRERRVKPISGVKSLE